ncbi:MAG: 30S ribosome-binding factor RbfA [Polyangiales bacterium]
MAEVKRSVRIGERLREELAALLVRDVQDPRVRGVIVTMVRMTADLQLARVRVRLPELDARDEVAHRKALLAGLESASGMLRRELGRRLGLRYAPKLAFYFDEAPEKRDRIDALLAEIEREGKKPDGE